MALVDHPAWVELDQVHIVGRVETLQTASQKKKDVMSVGSLLLVTITTTIELAGHTLLSCSRSEEQECNHFSLAREININKTN